MLSIRALKGHRRRVGATVELGNPQLLAGLRIDGPEAIIVRGADEQDPSAGYNSARSRGTTGVLLGVGKSLGDAERNLPSEVSGRGVDRRQPAPRRFLARPRGATNLPDPPGAPESEVGGDSGI